MNRTSIKNIDNEITNLNSGSEPPKNINKDIISMEQENEQTFFNFFRERMENSKHRLPLNLDFSEIRLEADGCQPQNFSTTIYSDTENISRQHEKAKIVLNGKVSEEICLIDFTDTQDLIPDSRKNRKLEKLATTSEDLYDRVPKHDISSLEEVNLVESRYIQTMKPAVTAMTGDLRQAVAKYETLQEINHGVKPLNKINLLNSKYVQLGELAPAGVDDISPQCRERTLETYKIKDIIILPREMNITVYTDVKQPNSSLATDVKECLNQDVTSSDSTPHQEVKHFMKREEQLGQDVRKNLPAGPPDKENSLEHETQNTKLSKYGTNVTHGTEDREVDINKGGEFSNSNDLQNRCSELNFAKNSMDDRSKRVVDGNESYEFQVDEIDFAEKATLLQQFNREDIERKRLGPNWLAMQRGENNSFQVQESYALHVSNFKKETIKKFDGLRVLKEVVTECNTSAYSSEVKNTKNKQLGSEKIKKKDVMEKKEFGDRTGKGLKEACNSPSTVVQAYKQQPFEKGKKQIQASAVEFQSDIGALLNIGRKQKRIISGCEEKAGEIMTEKIEIIGGENRKILLHDKGLKQNKIANTSIDPEFEGVSKVDAKGYLDEKKELVNNTFCFRPISEKNPPLDIGNGNDNRFQQERNLKMRMDSCVRYNHTNEQYRLTTNQSNDTNNLTTSGKEKFQSSKMKEIRHSVVKYPSHKLTVKAKHKYDAKELFKVQEYQRHCTQLLDDSKGSKPNNTGQPSDVKLEDVNLERLNSKSDLMAYKLIQGVPYSRKIISQAFHKRSSKPSVTSAAPIKEEMKKDPSQNASVKGFQNDKNFQNPRALIIGNCSNCVELRPLENEGKCLAGRNIFIKDVHQKHRCRRSKSRSTDRTESNSNVSKKQGKSPNKRVSFLENNRTFSYDPEKSVMENFPRSKTEKSYVGKGRCTEVGMSNGQHETFGRTGGYVNLGFVDVPTFHCLPDSENYIPNANISSFGEDEQLLADIGTTAVNQDQMLSVARWKAEGSMRRWLKYGLMAYKGISFKKVMAVISKK